MPSDSFMDLMAQALTIHGYECTRNAALEGRSGTVYTVPLLAESEERAVILDCHLGQEMVTLASAQDMADVMHDVAADFGVLCHESDVELEARQAGITFWGDHELRYLIGSAMMAQATGSPLEPLRLEPRVEPQEAPGDLDELLPNAFKQEEPAPMPSIDLDALEDLGGMMFDEEPSPVSTIHDMTGIEAASEALPPATPALDTDRFAYPLLPVRLSAEEGRIKLKDRMHRVESVQMVLQPVHLFDYECDLLAEGSLRYDTVSGRVQVHGTDKQVADVDAEAVDPDGFTVLTELPDTPGHERTLRCTDERAREKATDFLMETHTRLVDVEVDEDGFSYTEKKKVAPRPDHIRLHHLGIFHRVVWRFAGPNGHIDVDGLSGIVLDAALQTTTSDAIILD